MINNLIILGDIKGLNVMQTKKALFIFSIISIISVIFILITPVIIKAQDISINEGVDWLLLSQNPDGTWSSDARKFLDTYTALETLLSFNIDNPQVSIAINWVNGLYPDNTDDIAHKVLLLSLTEEDTTSELSALLDFQISGDAWGTDQEFSGDVLDTTLALQALKAVGHDDLETISYALAYLLSTQNEDGGSGFYEGDDSNVYMTALVLKVLSSYSSIFNIQSSINNAVSYLLTKQDTDGGFGSSPSTVYETALAFEALVESGQGQAQPLQDAIKYLYATQLPNGSWNEDPYSTAMALKALARVKPNLSISSEDIIFSNPTPTEGETVTITANIHNTGSAQADNVLIQFYDGDPLAGGVLIGETTMLSIPAYSSSLSTTSWTIPDAATHLIYLQIDPMNVIDELDETDNTASRILTSATLPDLSITPADIVFDPLFPEPGETVTITATIRNRGETGGNNITVDIYNGDQSAGGTLIGNATVSSIGPGSASFIQLTGSFTAGSQDIYVVIDKANTIAEGDEDNNTAMKTLAVGVGVIDLTTTGTAITFSPAYPVEGDIVTINATIYNEGEAEANNVLVRFYLGDPDSGGTQIGSDIFIPVILARDTGNINTAWDSTGHAGDNDIYVAVDPLNTIAETNEYNNKAFRTIKTGVSEGPDLEVSPADINYAPVDPVTGDTVTITANIRNIGTDDASNVLVEFSNGDPNVGGTLIIGSQTIPFIAQGDSVIVQITWATAGFSGTYQIYVNADPFNEIAELNETNNTGHLPITITAPQDPT